VTRDKTEAKDKTKDNAPSGAEINVPFMEVNEVGNSRRR